MLLIENVAAAGAHPVKCGDVFVVDAFLSSTGLLLDVDTFISGK